MRYTLFLILATITSFSYGAGYENKVGQGRLSVLFFDVYDIALHSPSGEFSFERPFSLTLHYLRDIKAEDIVESSIDEIQKLGFSDQEILSEWRIQLEQIMPSVTQGDSITATVDKSRQTSFYHNNILIGVITDVYFIPWFFGIWLGEESSRSDLRAQLLGE